jgi:YHS domain-containing protein
MRGPWVLGTHDVVRIAARSHAGKVHPKLKDIQTDCSVNAQVQGKTYCFGSQSALTQFMADPSGNLAKAQAYYSKKHPG